MARESNQRASGRIMVQIQCYGSATRNKGSGWISDLSRQGALISRTAVTPVRGDLVGISIDTSHGPVLLTGWVVRHIYKGFAIEFDHLDQNATEFIDDVAAIVPSRGRGKPSDK